MSYGLSLTVRVEHDDHPESPRQDRTNLGELRIWHRRYSFGDEGAQCPDDPSDFGVWAHQEDAVWLPVFMYDHGGTTINTTGFSCPWDSGQVGYIYATREQILECYGGKLLTSKRRAMARRDLEGQVRELDQWLRGDVWGYVIEDADGEQVDSLWGLYGEDYAKGEAARALRDALSEAVPA